MVFRILRNFVAVVGGELWSSRCRYFFFTSEIGIYYVMKIEKNIFFILNFLCFCQPNFFYNLN